MVQVVDLVDHLHDAKASFQEMKLSHEGIAASASGRCDLLITFLPLDNPFFSSVNYRSFVDQSMRRLTVLSRYFSEARSGRNEVETFWDRHQRFLFRKLA